MRFLFGEMDQLVDGEAASDNLVDGKRFMAKESGFLLEHGSSNVQEMVIPGDDYKGKNVARVDTTEHAWTSPRSVDAAGMMVEELTVRNFDSGNVETGGSGLKDKMRSSNNVWNTFFPDEMNSLHTQVENQNDVADRSRSRQEDNQPASLNTLLSPNGIRTKILSQSGFSQYFVKSSLKGKGVICSGPGPAREALGRIRGPNHPQAALVSLNSTPNSTTETTVHEGLSLREWLKAGQNKVDKSKNMDIFKQILDLVDASHSRGEPLQALRPSCFKLTPQNHVLYIGSPVIGSKEVSNLEKNGDKKREGEHSHLVGASQSAKRQKQGNTFRRWPQFAVHSGFKDSGYGFNGQNIPTRDNTYPIQNISNSQHLYATSNNNTYPIQNMSNSQPLYATPQLVNNFVGDPLEEQWYASPEDSGERCSTLSSNVYSLGILLFELLGSFESARAHAIAMKDLHQRILPPSFMLENPKETGFCLWLLHPEPSLRPTTRAILQSELINGIQTSSMKQMSTSIDQEDAESDLMLHFLASLNEQKQTCAAKLADDIKSLESDILEIESRQPSKTPGKKLKSTTFSSLGGSRLINNINHLEHAYFSVRSTIGNSDMNESGEREVLSSREKNIVMKNTEAGKKPADRLGIFFNGLCKYARYSKFEVRGVLRNGDFSSMGNVICSLGFDRDEDYFATAGVSKKIKVYDFHALLNDSVDIHYPAVEMSNKSRLSSICWNSYIRNYLASADYDGVVKIWDAGTGEAISHHIEHERRAWSVDFSRVDPIKLASGSDDCSVKLWSINEKKSLSTIKTVANVCCVQFSPYSAHLLSLGSADYKTYCYDLRNASKPLCTLSGHDRAVSYVKFLDSGTLVSASTDNTLKIWDLNKADFGCLSTSSCVLTLKGHTNEKNFVGLSVADGYIACGSETNEVFAYYRSLPMPITSHKFGSIDPVSGKETESESNHFVSSVCWRQKSDMVVAANSTGCLKLLQMV
ncbi:putative transcription factor WD40-like family [Helianthus annuus]|nr:putative transcription factor WD40-like family [Helianthus annuus]